MNKLIATIALAALAFTSCIKENDTWKEMLPVQPGMYIYQLATDQDKLAMRPANAALRQSLEHMLGGLKGQVFYARPRFCTDNGAMIAYAGCQRLLAGQHEGPEIRVQARWPMEQLPAI